MSLHENETYPEGLVSDIQRYTLHDGPGLRTLVFLKACPLRCLWCCNPEAQRPFPELSFFSRICIGCSECVRACPKAAIEYTEEKVKINRQLCNNCGKCTEVCPTGALTLIGKKMSWKSVMEELEKDRLFYEESKGGITLSGGEPFAQFRFTKKILEECKKRYLHTAIETCGYTEWEKFKEILEFTDLIIYDLKNMDSQIHKKLTRRPNELILNNLRKISKGFKGQLLIRIPMIPGYNDSEENISSTAKFIKELEGVKDVHLLPYHRLGVSKYEKLGKKYQLPKLTPPTKERRQKLVKLLRLRGFQVYVERT